MRENPWLERRVICYAHQGGAIENPSSTLHAIREAIAHGSTAIELDVHATADRQLVVCHDPTLDRTTNTTGEIARHTLAELLELDNSYWFVPGEDVQPDREPEDYPLRGLAPADHDYGIATSPRSSSSPREWPSTSTSSGPIPRCRDTSICWRI